MDGGRQCSFLSNCIALETWSGHYGGRVWAESQATLRGASFLVWVRFHNDVSRNVCGTGPEGLVLQRLRWQQLLKNIMRKSSGTPVEFVTGQVWQLADSKLEIGLVGRTLVHYKHYKGLALRPPTQLSSKTSLQKFLSDQEAVLLAKAPVLGPAGKGRGMRPAAVAKPAKSTKSAPKRTVRK